MYFTRLVWGWAFPYVSRIHTTLWFVASRSSNLPPFFSSLWSNLSLCMKTARLQVCMAVLAAREMPRMFAPCRQERWEFIEAVSKSEHYHWTLILDPQQIKYVKDDFTKGFACLTCLQSCCCQLMLTCVKSSCLQNRPFLSEAWWVEKRWKEYSILFSWEY